MPDVTQIRAPIRTARYRQVRVTVTQGPDRGRSIDVAGREVRIGTEVENDFVLNDEAVSRVHCALEPTELGLRVRDEGSTNGVWCAGTRIFDALFASSSVVLKLGDTELSVVPLDVTVERQQLELDRFGQMVGRSQRMRELFADLQRLASVDVSVLIEGETGTGKELVAEAIHDHSARAGQPLVVFDCGAVAPNLAESELFGHVRGAFTGAVDSRAGVFEQADGGTILLDELGELPRELQPKLLRVLEKREVRRLGSAQAIPVDVRLVAATNRNLAAEVQRGTFRDDLFFRIACAQVSVPALRARMDDLPLLVEHFMRRYDPSASVDSIPKQVWDMFRAHRWPGNVRELKNAVQRLLVTPDRPFAEWPAGSVPINEPAVCEHVISLREARQSAVDAFEKSYIKFVLHRAQGNITRAAASVEISRQMFHRLLRKHAID